MTLIHHLQIAGVLQWLLVAVNFAMPRRFRWREELARLSLINRQIFYVHAFFIVLLLVLFGALSFFYAAPLLSDSALAAPILGGLAFFWGVRLIFQLLVYSPKLWRGNRLYTALHVVFTCLWFYLAATYAAAFFKGALG